MCKEQQEKRFEQERTILVKNYENELQSMIDQQKKQVEKAEEQQHVDLKVSFLTASIFNQTISINTNTIVLALSPGLFLFCFLNSDRSKNSQRLEYELLV